MERGNGREMRKEVEERGRVRGGGKGEEEEGRRRGKRISDYHNLREEVIPS